MWDGQTQCLVQPFAMQPARSCSILSATPLGVQFEPAGIRFKIYNKTLPVLSCLGFRGRDTTLAVGATPSALNPHFRSHIFSFSYRRLPHAWPQTESKRSSFTGNPREKAAIRGDQRGAPYLSVRLHILLQPSLFVRVTKPTGLGRAAVDRVEKKRCTCDRRGRAGRQLTGEHY